MLATSATSVTNKSFFFDADTCFAVLVSTRTSRIAVANVLVVDSASI